MSSGESIFSYLSMKDYLPTDYTLRAIPQITDRALERPLPRLGSMHVKTRTLVEDR